MLSLAKAMQWVISVGAPISPHLTEQAALAGNIEVNRVFSTFC
jgi:hypothetical protein